VNNLAIIGSTIGGKKGKVITSAIEHFSVLLPANSLEQLGFKVVQVPVDEEGIVDLDILETLIDKDTVLVSIQLVNHEIGSIQPLREISRIVKEINPPTLIHTDAS